MTLTDEPLVLSLSMKGTDEFNSTTSNDSDSDIVSFYTAKNFDELGIRDQYKLSPLPGIHPALRSVSVPSTPSPVFLSTLRPVSVPPQFHDASDHASAC